MNMGPIRAAQAGLELLVGVLTGGSANSKQGDNNRAERTCELPDGNCNRIPGILK